MSKPNRFSQTKSFNKLERSDKIINTCSKTVKDGINARKALKMFRLHQSQKKLGESQSATIATLGDELQNTSGDVRKAIQDSIKIRTLCKPVKNELRMVNYNETIEGRFKIQLVNKNEGGSCINNKGSETKNNQKFFRFNPLMEENKAGKEEKATKEEKSKPKRRKKVKINSRPLIQDMSGDTPVLEASKPSVKSGIKLEKAKNSRNISKQRKTDKKISNKTEQSVDVSDLQTIKRRLKKRKLNKSVSYTSVCVSSGLTDLTQAVTKTSPIEQEFGIIEEDPIIKPSPRLLPYVASDTDISDTFESASLKSSLENVGTIGFLEQIERTHMEQFKLQASIEAALKITEKVSEGVVEPKADKPMQEEQSTTPTLEEIEKPLSSDTPKEDPNLVLTPSATAKACIEYNRTAQQALTLLNNEVSSALRETICSIDDIKFSVFNTIEKINESDQLYQKLKREQQQLATQSTPQLCKPQSPGESNCNNLLHALTFGLVQTQSENQVRLAVFPSEKPSETIQCVHEIDESPLEMPPLEYPVVNTEAKSTLLKTNELILPKIVPIIEPIDHPCTALRQQKIDIFNIPPCIPFNDLPQRRLRQTPSGDKGLHMIRKQPLAVGLKRRPSSPMSKVCRLTNRDLSPEIKLRLKEIAVRLGLDDLPRSRAQPDLYNKLIREFVATDSLIEFQRQMKHVNRKQEKKEEIKEVSEVTKPKNETKVIKRNKVVEIIAEELFVADKKINKIVETNLNGGKIKPAQRVKPKCCQFLYREKKKKRSHLHLKKVKRELETNSSNTIQLSTKPSKHDKDKRQKYADSLWFCSHNKKDLHRAVEKSPKQPITVTRSDTVIMCDSTKSISMYDTAAQTQSIDAASNKAYWRQRNLQTLTCKSGLDCFDILDEITLKDIQPLESEYPRKDHIGSEPYHRQTENTYLYKLVYESTQEQFLKLLSIHEPVLQCTQAGCQTCKKKTPELEPKKKSEENKKGDWYQTKPKEIKKGEWFETKASENKSKPITTPPNQNKTNKPQKKRSASLPNRPVNDSKTKPKGKKTKKEPDVATRLLPYMFDPKMRYPTTITVMPVTVTTYTNPNFVRTKSKGQDGDFSESKPTKTTKTPSTKPLHERKLWETKYAKSPSTNLMSYLEKQNLESQKQMLEDICNQNFVPKSKNVFIPATNLVKKPHPSQFQGHTLRTHSQPQCPVKTTKPKTVISRMPQKNPKKQNLEHDIQNVIEMIEGKIIDLVSSPDKVHSEAFSNVEKEIVDILKSMKTEGGKPLDSINEDVTKETEASKRKKIKKSTLHSNPSSDLDKEAKSITNNSLKLQGLITNEILSRGYSTDLEQKSSNEEVFEITSSCAPVHTPRSKAQNLNEPPKTIEEQEPTIEKKEGEEEPKIPTTEKKEEEEPKISTTEKKEEDEPKIQNASETNETKDVPEVTEPTPSKIQQKTSSQLLTISDSKMIRTLLESNTALKRSTTSKLGLVSVASKSKPVPVTSSLKTQVSSNIANQIVKSASISKPNIKLEPKPNIKLEPEPNIHLEAESETALVPLQTDIKSDQFLTPFMQALKQYREEEHKSSCNILEFLDTLTNITEGGSTITTITGCQLSTVHYKQKYQVANIEHEAEIFYPIFIWEPITMFPGTNKNLKFLYKSEKITNELECARSLFASLNLSKIVGYGNENIRKNIDLTGNEVVEVFPRLAEERKPLKALCSGVVTKAEVVKPLMTKYNENHAMFLNTVYGMIFTVVFLSLSFNYTC